MTTVQQAAVLSGRDAQRAAEAIELVADRLADPEQVAGIASGEANREPIYESTMWSPVTLSHGLPGMAMLYIELARFDQRWLAVAHRHLRCAAQELPKAVSYGLHTGPAAVLAAAQGCAGHGWAGHGWAGHYATLRRTLADWLVADQHKRIATGLARTAPGVAWADYDVIGGLSGTLRVLLDSLDDPAEASSAVESAVDVTLRRLVQISEPIEAHGLVVPGWWVPPELEPVDQDRRDYPQGDFNLGLAHGVAGPLTLLALALRRGHEVDGQRDAIARFAGWLAGWVLRDAAGSYWPCRVGWAEQVAAQRLTSAFTRSAWCYGAPGVAHALYQAGVAVDVPQWRQLAITGLRDVLARDETAWHLDGPTVCHGYAGLLQVMWRVGTASGDAPLQQGCLRLARSVLDFADRDRAFVFPHLVPDSPQGWRRAGRHRPLDVAGILEGAAGVACALLSVTPPHLLSPAAAGPVGNPQRSWDRCLALS
ncbi:MAG: lanthionine synthetase C family protein [Pseudonocardiaceae bacterium]